MADPVTSTPSPVVPDPNAAAIAAAAAETQRLQAEADENARRTSPAGAPASSFLDMFQGIITWFKNLIESILHPGTEDEHSGNLDSTDDHTPPPTTEQALAAAVSTSRKVTPAWQNLINANNGKSVQLTTPIGADTQVLSEFGGERAASGVLKAHKHGGVDLLGKPHTSLIAAADAVVVRRGYDAGGWGNFIELGLGDGTTIIYAHMFSQSSLTEGTPVKRGVQVGEMGNTGNAAGGPTHCHFEHQGRHALDGLSFDGKHISPEINGSVLHNKDRIVDGQVVSNGTRFTAAHVEGHNGPLNTPRTSAPVVRSL